MPISATGIWTVRQRRRGGGVSGLGPGFGFGFGFTLLELLVTLVLIGIITGVALLSINTNPGAERLAQEARRLAALIELNREEALLLSQPRGVRFATSGYRFVRQQPDGLWTGLSDGAQAERRLPADVKLRLTVEGEPGAENADRNAVKPQVLLLASGEVTPFSATFSAAYARGYTVTGAMLGQITLRAAR